MSKKNAQPQTGWQRFVAGWKGFWTWVLVAALIVGAVMAIVELSKLKEYK